MPSVDDLRVLLKRVRAASGPDIGLDGALLAVLDPPPTDLDDETASVFVRFDGDGYGLFKSPAGFKALRQKVPKLTASIDAALALVARVLPGAYGQVEFGGRKQGAHIYEEHHVGEPCFGLGCRPALAILAALLTALIAQKETPDV